VLLYGKLPQKHIYLYGSHLQTLHRRHKGIKSKRPQFFCGRFIFIPLFLVYKKKFFKEKVIISLFFLVSRKRGKKKKKPYRFIVLSVQVRNKTSCASPS
jgi:hypothetical protein